MTTDCPIRIKCSTKAALREQSLIQDSEGKPCEPYDSIIRRAVAALKSNQNKKIIDVSKI